jgi:tetratricopeptide (TPR) repeat protein
LLAIGRGDLMVGLVKLERGCSSPAVAERRLLIRPATPEEQRQAALAPPAKAADPAESGLTATRQGQAHLGAGHYQEAREAFDVALRYGDTNYVAWLGLGTAQVKLGEYAAALVSLQRAQVLAQRDGALGSVAAQAQYDLACVYAQQRRKPEALKAIAQAARLLGPDLLDEMEHDPDLEPIRSEPEFRRQAAALRAQRGKTQR